MSFDNFDKQQLIGLIKETAESMEAELADDIVVFAKMRAFMDSVILGMVSFSALGIMVLMNVVFVTWYSIVVTAAAMFIILAVGYNFLKKDYIDSGYYEYMEAVDNIF